ncbi:hypothetical protein NSPZN2_30151 [Nitrospira defluvii]|uniref:Uncharacterized protein n=1 Tax=Nitrospira defluvii TaxID=330214 RepID=A0ABM8RG11_9BACT|nr:hypothetical protein NSPZN2_30151 [Nitrospira defluvii]
MPRCATAGDARLTRCQHWHFLPLGKSAAGKMDRELLSEPKKVPKIDYIEQSRCGRRLKAVSYKAC